LPLEQTVLTEIVEPRKRTALFAHYSVVGSLAGALGILAASLPDLMAQWTGIGRGVAIQYMFALYALTGAVTFLLYRPLSPAVEAVHDVPKAPLHESKRLVYGLAALFGMDSFGTGFLVQSLLALWLYQNFSYLNYNGGGHPVLDQCLLCDLIPRRRADRRAHRADQHDGVYPSAVERPADAGAVRAGPGNGHWPAART
jgi:MFS family permease